jgi:hypothetical protein
MPMESNFWRLLRQNIEGHLVRIENAISAGCPDVNACFKGSEVWCELKAGSRQSDIYLRVSQLSWMIRRVSNGGKVKVVYKVKDLIGIVDGKELVKHKDNFRSTVNQTVYLRVQDIEHETFKKPYDWARINELIYK